MKDYIMEKHAFLLAISVLPFFGGCEKPSRDLELWHTKRLAILGQIMNCSQQPCLTSSQLVRSLGEPDSIIKPAELEATLRRFGLGGNYLESAVNDTYSEYCRFKEPNPRCMCTKGTTWTLCDAFKNCTLWLYDEAARFQKPIAIYGCIKNEGFVCEIYIVEDSNIVGRNFFYHHRGNL
jgi:hypothetical protein